MANAAILVGNSQYRHLNDLECCRDDISAVKELLEATGKYDSIVVIENVEADELKSRIRTILDGLPGVVDELFFYFTGHGHQQEDEFYHCAMGFDSRRPNETGLSTTELHTLLRLAGADLVVKVVDACNSGTVLVKATNGIMQEKHGFKNLIQISSCLDTQNSLTGDPLSVFTDKFRAATLRKHEGIVYYTDVIFALRDEFLQDNAQTPFFVSQGTGRERFVDDAKQLDGLRAKLITMDPSSASDELLPSKPNLRDLLEKSEQKIATPDQVDFLVGSLFDSLIKRISIGDFADFFDLDFVEHSDFKEPTAEAFIIRVMDKESRPDNFVTATITRKYKQNSLSSLTAFSITQMFGGDREFSEIYDLSLNLSMRRAQLKITLTPKFNSLRRLVLVVSCAPSLERCYVFEIGTQHRLRDFGEFELIGDEVVRRWYKLEWQEGTRGIVEKIATRLSEVIREHLEFTETRPTKDKP